MYSYTKFKKFQAKVIVFPEFALLGDFLPSVNCILVMKIIHIRNLRIIPLRLPYEMVLFVYCTKVFNWNDKLGVKPSLLSTLQVLCCVSMLQQVKGKDTPPFSQGHLLLASPEKLHLSKIRAHMCISKQH